MFSKLWSLIQGQPVFFVGLINAMLAMLVTFGLHMTVEQIGAILTFVNAGLAFALQRAVTPIASPSLSAGTEVKVLGTEATTVIGEGS